MRLKKLVTLIFLILSLSGIVFGASPITGFHLVQSDTSETIGNYDDISGGHIFHEGQLPSNFGAFVNLSDSVGSVGFSVNGSFLRFENNAPYSLFGDTITANGTTHAGGEFDISIGKLNTISATPYPNTDQGGTAMESVQLDFTVNSGVDALTLTVKLTWNDNSDNESGFNIERSREGGPFEVIGRTGVDIAICHDHTVEYDVEYAYRVNAYNEFGVSGYTNTAYFIKLGPPRDLGVTMIWIPDYSNMAS